MQRDLHVQFSRRNNYFYQLPITVQDVALMGQTLNSKWGANYSSKSYELVHEALHKLGLYDLRKNRIGELSGGQQQKVFLARSLVQEAEIFFLDEPLVGVDYTTQGATRS